MAILKIRDENGKVIEVPAIKGEDGHTPVKGTDYFTQSDIAEIVNAVYAKVADGNEVVY